MRPSRGRTRRQLILPWPGMDRGPTTPRTPRCSQATLPPRTCTLRGRSGLKASVVVPRYQIRYIHEVPIFHDLYQKFQSAETHTGQKSDPSYFSPCSFSRFQMPCSTPGFETVVRCFHMCTVPPIQRALVPFFNPPTFRTSTTVTRVSSLPRRPPHCNVNPFRNHVFGRYPFCKESPWAVKAFS